MRFLADEDFPGPVVASLRGLGHDVTWVAESMRRAFDPVILDRARAEHRVVLTCDKDFGELAFRDRLPAECGIVLFRLGGADPATDNARALAALQSRDDWVGHFAVVTDNRIRLRRLPPTPGAPPTAAGQPTPGAR